MHKLPICHYFANVYICITVTHMPSQLVVRAKPELIALIQEVAEARGEYVADLVRRAVKVELARLSFLSDFEKKALGLELEASRNFKKTQTDVSKGLGKTTNHRMSIGGSPRPTTLEHAVSQEAADLEL